MNITPSSVFATEPNPIVATIIPKTVPEMKLIIKSVSLFHLEEPPVFLKIILARKTIAKFCQKVKYTPNQDKMSPSNHASKNILAVTITTARKVTPRAVESFMSF